ncbi:hypothetical protein ACLOAV_004445 [Pseudogymnoascus australis]
MFPNSHPYFKAVFQPAALIQIFEDVICDDYYRRHSHLLPPAAVQKELALVRGLQQMAPLFARMLCTVPYGLLAERIRRKRVLILSRAGVFTTGPLMSLLGGP